MPGCTFYCSWVAVHLRFSVSCLLMVISLGDRGGRIFLIFLEQLSYQELRVIQDKTEADSSVVNSVLILPWPLLHSTPSPACPLRPAPLADAPSGFRTSPPYRSTTRISRELENPMGSQTLLDIISSSINLFYSTHVFEGLFYQAPSICLNTLYNL